MVIAQPGEEVENGIHRITRQRAFVCNDSTNQIKVPFARRVGFDEKLKVEQTGKDAAFDGTSPHRVRTSDAFAIHFRCTGGRGVVARKDELRWLYDDRRRRWLV
ncbi:MAG: hypothetical protein Rhob2KO_53950 [Rhodopirellula baltica]